MTSSMLRLAIATSVLTTLGSAACSLPESSLTPTDAAAPIQLAVGSTRWFGFIAIDCGWDDPLDAAVKTTYTDEVAGFTNVSHLCVADEQVVLGPRVQAALAAGLRPMLHIEPILFRTVAGASPAGNGERLTLRPDAAAAWSRFVAANRAVLTSTSIAALYLADEPTWRGATAADQAAAVAIVDATHPGLTTAIVEAYPVVDQWQIPPALDWVGFDRYFTFDPSRDADWQADFRTLLRRRTRADQRVVIAMDTQWLPIYGDYGLTQAQMSQVAYNYLAVAASDPAVVAVLGYLWPGGLDDPMQRGARDLPASVRATYRRIGQAILANAASGR